MIFKGKARGGQCGNFKATRSDCFSDRRYIKKRAESKAAGMAGPLLPASWAASAQGSTCENGIPCPLSPTSSHSPSRPGQRPANGCSSGVKAIVPVQCWTMGTPVSYGNSRGAITVSALTTSDRTGGTFSPGGGG